MLQHKCYLLKQIAPNKIWNQKTRIILSQQYQYAYAICDFIDKQRFSKDAANLLKSETVT